MGDPELRQDRKVAAVRASLLCALVNLILALSGLFFIAAANPRSDP
jgi:hypothetical protein